MRPEMNCWMVERSGTVFFGIVRRMTFVINHFASDCVGTIYPCSRILKSDQTTDHHADANEAEHSYKYIRRGCGNTAACETVCSNE